jgi:hypothetical protein
MSVSEAVPADNSLAVPADLNTLINEWIAQYQNYTNTYIKIKKLLQTDYIKQSDKSVVRPEVISSLIHKYDDDRDPRKKYRDNPTYAFFLLHLIFSLKSVDMNQVYEDININKVDKEGNPDNKRTLLHVLIENHLSEWVKGINLREAETLEYRFKEFLPVELNEETTQLYEKHKNKNETTTETDSATNGPNRKTIKFDDETKVVWYNKIFVSHEKIQDNDLLKIFLGFFQQYLEFWPKKKTYDYFISIFQLLLIDKGIIKITIPLKNNTQSITDDFPLAFTEILPGLEIPPPPPPPPSPPPSLVQRCVDGVCKMFSKPGGKKKSKTKTKKRIARKSYKNKKMSANLVKTKKGR